ncbi:DsbA family protein [Tsuneonella amylolytica]|uniref:DsbA family protein n=1 Tax=Tsuneonella amylolytica TaxID=2338327 RepID=UPI000EA855BB|nr:thioredoxin domain-containing protein [Tsuneonella amylolytica]
MRALHTPVLAISVGVALMLWMQRSDDQGRSLEGSPLLAQIRDDEHAPRLGRNDAQVTIVVYTDYQCPICRAASRDLEAAIGRDRDVTILVKEWPILGPVSLRAARVALATADQGIYPAVHRALLKRAVLDEKTLRDVVRASGGSWETVEATLKNDELGINASLARNAREAFALGLQGTPGYIVGDTLVQGQTTKRRFRQLIQRTRNHQ